MPVTASPDIYDHDPLILCCETLKKSTIDEKIFLGPANSSPTSSGFFVEGFSIVLVSMEFICELDIISIRFWVGIAGQSCQCTRNLQIAYYSKKL